MNNTGIIITMAYPETIVKVSDEWFCSYLKFIGIGKKNFVRAGHAALALIHKETGTLEYYDFGRYITPPAHGRVRGKDTDHELDFPLAARLENNKILNLRDILKFFGTNPKLTHGEGKLIASVCDQIDYEKAKAYITKLQNHDFIKYGVFINKASNCSRFVTDTLINSVTDEQVRRRLMRSNRFTPSTVGNVIISDTQKDIYEVSENGDIKEFRSTVRKENIKHFLDRLKEYEPNLVGKLHPKPVLGISQHAQWLGGVGAGAWFELHQTEQHHTFRFQRISAYGNIDVNGFYALEGFDFIYEDSYEFIHYSNCRFFHIQQNGKTFRFNLLEKIS